MRNQIEYIVYGQRALFSDPFTKIGGEKSTYSIPTYEALRGITESIYWKPTIEWVIDRVRIINKIKKVSSGQRLIKYSGGVNDLATYQYLNDVKYEIQAHFEFNEKRQDLRSDYNENKHWEIALRSIKRGGRFPIFLGCSECMGMVEPCKFGEKPGYYDGIDIDFDKMFHHFVYPNFKGGPSESIFVSPEMKNGIIDFSQCKDFIRYSIKDIKQKEYTSVVKPVDEEYNNCKGVAL